MDFGLTLRTRASVEDMGLKARSRNLKLRTQGQRRRTCRRARSLVLGQSKRTCRRASSLILGTKKEDLPEGFPKRPKGRPTAQTSCCPEATFPHSSWEMLPFLVFG